MVKHTLLALLVWGLSMPSFANSDHQIVSYGVGYEMAWQYLNVTDTDLDDQAFLRGMEDAIQRKTPIYSVEQIEHAREKIAQKEEETQAQHYAENRAKGQAFLRENAKKSGVITTKSGLQYKILKQGTGKKPQIKSMVTVYYTGRLIDDVVFDSTENREAETFRLDQVIAGWGEGLQYLQEGGEIELYIPEQLAYGKAALPAIPIGSTLIFKVKLLNVK